MTAQTPAKTQGSPSSTAPKNKFDPFRPDMPQIPGVNQTPPKAGGASSGIDSRRLLQFAGIAAAVAVLGAAIFWWSRSKSAAPAASSPGAEVAEQPAPPVSPPVAPVQSRFNVAATVTELSKPWTAKKFVFMKPFTRENIDAMVIRLPGGELWAFALQDPTNHCTLEFVTDLRALSAKYGYKASHPMVANPCNKTLYDPLKLSTLENNTWIRGAIAVGYSPRPPTAIEVTVSRGSIVADNIE